MDIKMFTLLQLIGALLALSLVQGIPKFESKQK